MISDMGAPKEKVHILIAGPGRSGTTLLLSLFDALGFETAAERLTYNKSVRAGLEAELMAADAPHVVKRPNLMQELPRLTRSGALDPRRIEAVVVPLRELDQVVISRITNSIAEGNIHAAGGVVVGSKPSKRALTERISTGFYAFLHWAAEYEVPVVLLSYPQLALDVDYAYRRLSPLAQCTYEEFQSAWQEVVRPDFVHSEPLVLPRWAGARLLLLGVRFKLSSRRSRRRDNRHQAASGTN